MTSNKKCAAQAGELTCAANRENGSLFCSSHKLARDRDNCNFADHVGAVIAEDAAERAGKTVQPTVCCTPTAEETALLAAGDYTPEELWGGKRPTCPKCFGHGSIPARLPGEGETAYRDRCKIANPVSPSGGEVETLAWKFDSSGEVSTVTDRWDVAKHVPYPRRELVDRAHVTRLQAENEALQQLLNDRDQKVDDYFALAERLRNSYIDLEAEKFALEDQVKGLQELLNAPELHDFAKGVTQEAAHQRDRWGTTHDAGKGPADWFWLIGYLAQKAMTAHMLGTTDKALHHCISTAAALNNWHASIMGVNTDMRPGIEPPAENEAVCRGDKNLGTACGSCKRCKARDV